MSWVLEEAMWSSAWTNDANDNVKNDVSSAKG